MLPILLIARPGLLPRLTVGVWLLLTLLLRILTLLLAVG